MTRLEGIPASTSAETNWLILRVDSNRPASSSSVRSPGSTLSVLMSYQLGMTMPMLSVTGWTGLGRQCVLAGRYEKRAKKSTYASGNTLFDGSVSLCPA
jgi:hypothetical protein